MKERTFLSDDESFDLALSYVRPTFKPLAITLDPDILGTLSNQLRAFCADTYVLKEEKPALEEAAFLASEDIQTFGDVLNENIRQLLSVSKSGYIQCLAH